MNSIRKIGFVGIAVVLSGCSDAGSPFGRSWEEMTWSEKAETNLSRARWEAAEACEAEIGRNEEEAEAVRRERQAREDARGSGVIVYRRDVLQLCGGVMGEIRAAGISHLIDPNADGGIPRGL